MYNLVYFYHYIKNPRIWIQKLAEFLHIDCSESLINDVAERTQFSNHKAAISKSNREDKIKQDSLDGTNYMYRKGNILNRMLFIYKFVTYILKCLYI